MHTYIYIFQEKSLHLVRISLNIHLERGDVYRTIQVLIIFSIQEDIYWR